MMKTRQVFVSLSAALCLLSPLLLARAAQAQTDRGGPSTVVPRKDTLMGAGVSIELARLRAKTVSDVHYALQLHVT
ncbi:MAG: hypothetical protein ABJB66_16065, partial [Gemmatimonadaceae bacterium]